MGWLGFPFAMALFGPEATAPIVALYWNVAFGNAWAVTAVTTAPQSKLNILKGFNFSALYIDILCCCAQTFRGPAYRKPCYTLGL